MNNLNDYEEYFKNLTESYKRLKGFYHIDLFDFDSFAEDLRGNKFQVPLLILESYTIKTIANYSDNVHDSLDCALVILGRYDIRNKTVKNKTDFISEMEHITKQVRAKMIADHQSPCSPIYGLRPQTIDMNRTDSIAGVYQGYRMTFTIETKADVTLDNDWTA